MTRTFFAAMVFCLTLPTCIALASSAPPGSDADPHEATGAAPDPDPAANDNLSASPLQEEQEDQLRLAIAQMESLEGAYSPALSEHLLSLGLALQAQQRHEEAMTHLRRAVHLTRINDGLYAERQIPLLQAEIFSLTALGQYAKTDVRQNYLHRVQWRALRPGPGRASALMQQGEWQYQAYRLNLPGLPYMRLLNMRDLYQLALSDLMESAGDTSPQLLAPLRGMLRADYLISSHPMKNQPSLSADNMAERPSFELNRFYAYKARSYTNGKNIIGVIYDIERRSGNAQSLSAVNALTMLGDWQLLHNHKEDAWQAYRDALAELAERDDAQLQAQRLFGSPVALPAIAGLSELPPSVDPEQGDILLAFGVSDIGRVQDVERLDENPQSDAMASRFMRKLRGTLFRPRFDAGQPVTTDKLVRAYDVQ